MNNDDSLWGKLTGSFDKLKTKVKSLAATPVPLPTAPAQLSNASLIKGGSKRKKRTKKVRFSKKNKVHTYHVKSRRRKCKA
jgi:hypothetical protein